MFVQYDMLRNKRYGKSKYEKAADAVEQACFSCAVGADDGGDFALTYVEADSA